MNIVVFKSGDVYTFGGNAEKPSEWMSLKGIDFEDITYIQGSILSEVAIHDLRQNNSDECLDDLWELLYSDSRATDRADISDLDEFAALALSEGVLGSDFSEEASSTYEVVNNWLAEEFGMDEQSEGVRMGVFEIDWESAERAFQDLSNHVMLKGESRVYVVEV